MADIEKMEIAKVVLLDTKCYILKIKDIAIGGNNFVNIAMKDVLTEAVKSSAPKIILVHNHPSGISTPSKQDFEVTYRLESASKILGIQLLDHIVIGKSEYTSIMSIKDWKSRMKI